MLVIAGVDVLLSWWLLPLMCCCYACDCWCWCVAMLSIAGVDVLLLCWWLLVLMCCYAVDRWCWCACCHSLCVCTASPLLDRSAREEFENFVSIRHSFVLQHNTPKYLTLTISLFSTIHQSIRHIFCTTQHTKVSGTAFLYNTIHQSIRHIFSTTQHAKVSGIAFLYNTTRQSIRHSFSLQHNTPKYWA